MPGRPRVGELRLRLLPATARRCGLSLGLVAVLAAACGTTVPMGSTVAAGQQRSLSPSGNGLGEQSNDSAPAATTPSGSQMQGAAAPGTAGTGQAHRDSSTGAELPSSGSAPVLSPSATRGPLRIGFMYSDNAAANAALGVATSNSSGPRPVMTALVSAFNKRGGLAGRQLQVDYYPTDATANDYSAAATTACTHYTQDDPVPVVLDLSFGDQFGMAPCLARHGIADLGLGTADTEADNQARLFAAPSAMTSTRRYRAVLSGMHQTGYLGTANKIGVLLEDCPELERAYQRAVVPTISQLRLHLADTEKLSCTVGYSSAGAASAAVQSAALKFRSSGVDRILMVSNFEQVTLLLMANYAESQGWHPGYLLSSTAQTEVMRANIPSGQWPQLHGMGWSPGVDIDDPRTQPVGPDKRCLSLLHAGGVNVTGWQNTYVATTVCSVTFLLEAALQANKGDARGTPLVAAIEALGSGFITPATVTGKTSFSRNRHDGPSMVAPFGFVASCACLKYVGPAIPAS